MASLLGGEYCIESLHRDVQDLQSIIDEVQSRIGQVKYQSWKFPDKAASDLNILKLLENCRFSEENEENQMSHVMLYDLVIDRLVYLLQNFICFNEILLDADGNMAGFSPSLVKKGAVRSMSIGLSVKKCWARITQIAATLQKLAKQANERPTLIPLTNSKQVITKGCDELEMSPNKSPDSLSDKDVSCDIRSVGCQTAESAYVTCEACSKAQDCVHDVGRAIIKLCKEQSLPTALEDYQSRYSKEYPMSVADLLRWAKHQHKDLSRISRHMCNLMKQVNPLKADLESAIKSQKAAMSELQSSQAVFDRKANELREEFRRKEYVLKEGEKDLKKKISTLELIKSSMEEEIEKFKWKISDLKDELLQKHRDHLSIENSMSQFKEEAIEGRQYKKDAIKFKSELSRVNCKVNELEQAIGHDRQLYERERTKNENMAQHEKMLQDKQKSLLRRMESLNEECDKLREQVLFLEDERDASVSKFNDMEKYKSDHEKSFQDLQNSVNDQHSEVESLQESIESLQQENQQLRDSVANYCERERLIVAYPDLNQDHVKSPMTQGSGDVLTDMRSQIDANTVRIEVLQKENDALLKTLQSVGSPISANRSPEIYSHRTDTTTRSDVPAWAHFSDNQESETIQLWKATDISSLLVNDGKPDSRNASERQHSRLKIHPEKHYQNLTAMESTQTKTSTGRTNTWVRAPNRSNKRCDVPNVNGIRVSEPGGNSSKNRWLDETSPEARNSFTVGAGRRSSARSRPSSAKSALFKPWT